MRRCSCAITLWELATVNPASSSVRWRKQNALVDGCFLREATAKPTISRKRPNSGRSLRSLLQNKETTSAQMHDACIMKSQRTMDCMSGMSVDAVMRQWPATIRLFLAHGMGSCIGCPVGRLHTVQDACSVSGVAVGTFVASLHETIQTISSTS